MTLVMVGEVQPLVQIEETTIKQSQICIHMYVIYIYMFQVRGPPQGSPLPPVDVGVGWVL